ncbi:hypothetical protein VN12_23160 [Pirellula sp. SH-Sr6A]|uniref:hypothetical protein n=1 Tax=Pirellula sp. SH-Sr6A TaxID=1632865 RepID=UPI00078D5488|nr:hypothetical protein [Pirellula sp. SH-Sr6A]AMV35045.1 hypothetical protein VN12_23160 [Pirellula sp. SH-Sr6A]
MTINPYHSQSSGSDIPEFPSSETKELRDTFESLSRWQLLVAILGVLITAFWTIVPMVQFLAYRFSNARGIRSLLLVTIYFGFSILMYAIPTWKLFQAIQSLRRYRSRSSSVLEVVQGQLSFWRTVGWIAMLLVAYYLFAILYSLFYGFGVRPF